MTHHPPAFVWLIGICCLLTPGMGGAQVSEDVPRPLVLDMTTLSPQPRTSAVQALIGEQTPFEPGTYPLISGASPDFLDLFRWVYPSDEHLVCPGDLVGLPETLEQARGLVVELELDRALVTLRRAFETLPCQHEAVTTEMLRRIFYYEGIARYYEGDTTGSLRAFLAALAIDPSGDVLPGFPPEIDTAYQDAARRLESLPEVSLAIDAELKQADVRVDGVPVPDLGDRIVLHAGYHVVQVFNAAGVARTETFFLDGGESRPLSVLVDIMPPGSTSYLNALFRTAIQQFELDSAQKTALDAYCRIRHHPYIIMVVVSVETGVQALVTYVPGTGLIKGVPEGLEPLPPMEEVEAPPPGPAKRGWLSRRRQRKRDEAKAREARAQADDSGIAFEGTRPVPPAPEPASPGREIAARPSADTPPALSRHARERRPRRARAVARFEIGTTSYQGDMFGGLFPSITLPVLGPIGLHAGIFYGSDFGVRTDALLNLVGLRLGVESGVPFESFALRTGLGGSFTAARLITSSPGVTEVLIEGTPEAWVGLDYLLDERIRLGIELGGGFSPGVTDGASAHGLWRFGLLMGWSL